MTRTKSILGALVLCALSIGAFAAVSASASELTAVTCKNTNNPAGQDSHCTTGSSGLFETVALPLNTTTEVESHNTEIEPTLRATLAGSSFTVICENSSGTGKVTNKEPTSLKHTIEFKEGVNTYSKCHAVLKSNEARFCSVEGITAPGGVDMISTSKLKGTTTGVNHQVILEPEAGAFSEFKILKAGANPGTESSCWTASSLTVQVTGKVECEANTTNHAHLTCTEANNGTALKVGGGEAKYIDTVGFNMKGEPEVTVGATTFT